MYDSRTNLSSQVASEVKKYFKDKVFRSAVPRNIRLSEAPSYSKPAVEYDSYSRGSVAYFDIAKELMERNGVSMERDTAYGV